MSFRLPLTRPTPAQMEHWRQVRTTGKRNFVLKVGVIRVGGTMFALMTALDLLRNRPFRRGVVDYVFEIVLGLLVWPLAGYCWGAVMWRFYEWHFSRASSQQPTSRT